MQLAPILQSSAHGSHRRAFALMVLLSGFLAGCGQKGALFLPAAAASASASAPVPAPAASETAR